MPRKPRSSGRKPLLRLVTQRPVVGAARPPRKQNTPMHEDWSVIAHEGVKFFNQWGIRDSNVRKRVIEIVMERWHAAQLLRNDLQRGNEELNQKENRLREIEAEHDLLLRRLIQHPQDPSLHRQRMRSLASRKRTNEEMKEIINRLIPQIRMLKRRLRPIPGGIKKELNSLAKPFWDNMVEILVELSAK